MVTAVIVAAGRGVRMGPNVDKLFLQLRGRPVVLHTWMRFDTCSDVDQIVLVTRPETASAFQELTSSWSPAKPYRIVDGGKERQDSVWNGLQAVSSQTEVVVIQDAARPCTRHELISATIQAAREIGAAVAAQPVTDTIKETEDGVCVTRTLDRSRLWAVQTPQTFRADILRKALSEVRQRGLRITDDTAACELIHQPVKLVASLSPNPKVTRREDLAWIEALLGCDGVV